MTERCFLVKQDLFQNIFFSHVYFWGYGTCKNARHAIYWPTAKRIALEALNPFDRLMNNTNGLLRPVMGSAHSYGSDPGPHSGPTEGRPRKGSFAKPITVFERTAGARGGRAGGRDGRREGPSLWRCDLPSTCHALQTPCQRLTCQ